MLEIIGGAQRQMVESKITIWGTTNCPACILCKQACESLNLNFEYKDIDKGSRAEFLEKFPAIFQVPLIEWNGKVYEGYEKFAEAIESNINNYGDGQL